MAARLFSKCKQHFSRPGKRAPVTFVFPRLAAAGMRGERLTNARRARTDPSRLMPRPPGGRSAARAEVKGATYLSHVLGLARLDQLQRGARHGGQSLSRSFVSRRNICKEKEDRAVRGVLSASFSPAA